MVETAIHRIIPHAFEGRIAIVTDVGRGMRWTQAAHETKRAARGRRSRVVLTSRRRCQAPGKLTLLRGDGDKKARSPGRARRKPLKPFAQGMPGRSGEPVVTMLVCFIYFAREATGALTHPAFPAPSVIEGFMQQPGRIAPREGGGVRHERHCEPTGRANARPMTGSAKQSRVREKTWIASSLCSSR